MQSKIVNLKSIYNFYHLKHKYQINYTIDRIHSSIIMADDVKVNANRKLIAVKELKTLRKKIIKKSKEIITFLCILFVLTNSLSLKSGQ